MGARAGWRGMGWATLAPTMIHVLTRTRLSARRTATAPCRPGRSGSSGLPGAIPRRAWSGALVLAALLLPGPALASLELARKHACMNCHAAERKLIGPSYRDVLRRYEGKADAVELLAERIRAGGAGRWGPVPMPAQPRLSEAEARALAVWVLEGGR